MTWYKNGRCAQFYRRVQTKKNKTTTTKETNKVTFSSLNFESNDRVKNYVSQSNCIHFTVIIT